VQQRFARLGFGAFSVLGYSVAGEETVIQSPELGVCFDIGRGPQFSLTSDYLCLSHGHMDHIAGLAYFVSQRYFLGLKPPTILLPLDIADDVDDMLKSFRRIERQQTPYRLAPLAAGELYECRKDLGIRTFSVHHGSSAMGFAVISIREKLRPEFHGLSGPELVEMKKKGTEIQYRLEVPLLAYLGDTTAGKVFEHPDVVNARVLLTECTFFDHEHRTKAKAGKHLHVDDFVRLLPGLKNEHIVVGHVSRRTGVRRARNILRKLVGEAEAKRIHFLMDFDGSTDAGDAGELAPPEAD
jgi:ribonuclease Z